MKCKYLYFYIAQQKFQQFMVLFDFEELARTYNFFHQNENCEEPSLASRLIRSNKGKPDSRYNFKGIRGKFGKYARGGRSCGNEK